LDDLEPNDATFGKFRNATPILNSYWTVCKNKKTLKNNLYLNLKVSNATLCEQ